MRRWLNALLGALAAAAVLAGCSGSNTSAPTFGVPTPAAQTTVTPAPAAPSPTAAAVPAVTVGSEIVASVDPAASPAAATVAAASAAGISVTNAVPVVLPSDPSGVGGAIALPLTDPSSGAQSIIPAGTAVDEQLTSSPTSDVPVLAAARVPQRRGTLSDARRPLFFLALSFSNAVTLARTPAMNFRFPAALPTTNAYYIALFDPTRPSLGWQYGFAGPARLNGTTCPVSLCFDSQAGPLSFRAFATYYFAVYAQSLSAAVPTPAPSNAPTTTPAPTPAPVVAAPASLSFSATGAAAAQTVTISEAGFSGTFRAIAGPECAGVIALGGASPSFTVTPVAAGTCRVGIAGDRGASVVIPVAVTLPPAGTLVIPPAPSASPSAAAFPAPAPTALLLATAGALQNVTLTVSGVPGYSGPLFASTSDGASVAQVSPGIWTSALPATFTVSGLTAGSGLVRVSDNAGRVLSVPFTVVAASTRTSTIFGSGVQSLSLSTSSSFPGIAGAFISTRITAASPGTVAYTASANPQAAGLPAFTPAAGAVQWYGGLTPSVAVSTQPGAAATLTFTPLVPVPAGANPVLTFFDGTTWRASVTGTVNTARTVVTFTGNPTQSFVAGQTVGYAISY